MNKDSNTEKPVAGDGTQTRKSEESINWYGPSQEPQEEFVNDMPNRVDDPPSPPEEEEKKDPPSSSPQPSIVAPETIP
jgi:hypothetical protein